MMPKQKIKINSTVSCSYSTDGKVTTCHLCLVFKNELCWKLIPIYPNMQISDDHVTINTKGVAICHDDDGFDEMKGRRIAQRRAYMKALKIAMSVVSKIDHIITQNKDELIKTKSSMDKLLQQYTKENLDVIYSYDEIYSD